jgi:hypothetical protein
VACYRNDALGAGIAGIVSKRRNRAYGTGRYPHRNYSNVARGGNA